MNTLIACFLAVATFTMSAQAATQAKRVSDLSGGRVCAMVPLNGGLWLAVVNGSPQRGEVWFSDGTSAGTVFVKEIPNAGEAWQYPGPVTFTLGNTVVFGVEQHEMYWPCENAVWRSDGTAEGTALASETTYETVFLGVTNGSLCFCLQYQRQIWRTDGTQAGTYVLTADILGWGGQTVNGITYFIGQCEESGRELWRTDGTVQGTYMVKDLAPGEEDGATGLACALDNILYFSGDDAEGHGLFRTDGTEQGTAIVKRLKGMATEYWPPVILGDFAVFYGNDGIHGTELWRTDGTPDGTAMIKDLDLGSNLESWTWLQVAGASAYFFLRRPEGYQLWKTDGTDAGTTRIAYESPETYVLNPPYIKGLDNYVYFSRMKDNGDLENRLFFRSDGTAEGTVLLADLHGLQVEDIWNYGDTVYFAMDGRLGMVKEMSTEWVDLVDVGLGVTQEISSRLGRRPVAFRDQTYLCGRDGGLWAVNPALRFTKMPSAPWREVGDRLDLSVECEGGFGTLSYQWMLDGDEISGATEAVYNVDSVTEDHEGSYTCRVRDDTDTVYETEPVLVEVFEAGSLPAAGPLALLALVVMFAFAFLAARREKNTVQL